MNTLTHLTKAHNPIESYADAVRAQKPTQAQSDQAQRKLMARIESERKPNRSFNAGWGWATAAVLAVLIVPVLIMMPGSNGSLAFAQVQSYFTAFDTMKARMTTQMNGNTILAMDILVDDQDRTRLDAGDDFSFIIDPQREMMLQLFHRQQLAIEVPIEDDSAGPQEDPMEWLAQIREFQGQTRKLDEDRVIRGQEAVGFRLSNQAIDMTLWAAESGEPLLLEMQTGPEAAATTTRIDFEFNLPVDAERFSLTPPAGYRLNVGDVDAD